MTDTIRGAFEPFGREYDSHTVEDPRDEQIARLRAESEADRRCHAVYVDDAQATIAELRAEVEKWRAAYDERSKLLDVLASERADHLEELTFLAAMVSKTRAAQPIEGHTPNLRATVAGMLLDLDGYRSALNMALAERNRLERKWYDATRALADLNARLARVYGKPDRVCLVCHCRPCVDDCPLHGWEAP